MSNAHDWGILVEAPLNGLWCRKCGYSQASDMAAKDCSGSTPTGKVLSVDVNWTNSPVQMAELQMQAMDAAVELLAGATVQ